MADGQIKISIEVDGKQVEVASKDLDNLAKSGHTSGKGVKEAEDGLKGVGKESEKASGSVKKFVATLGLVAIGATAFAVLKSSLDDAISRFDTLNKFPKVLQELGVSAEDSQRAMQRLSDGTDGLPTKLDDIASTAQRMYTSFGDMDKATDSALALNNTLLGSAASAEQASRGTEMYLKALQTGQIDLQTWRSLSETMDVGLVKLAESFGYAGASAKDDLYQALKSGDVTMTEFNDKLIEIGTGTGIMAKLAKENSLGLATSLTNLKTAVSRNLANVIESFDKLSKEVTGKDIAQNIDALKGVINSAFKVITRVIEGATPVVKFFAGAVKATIPVVDLLSPAIIGLISAYGAYAVISKAATAIDAVKAVITTAQGATKTLTLLTTAQVAAQVASTGATQADVVAKTAQVASIKLSTLVVGVLTGTISLSTAAQVVATAATYAWGAAIRFLMGPVGWIITGIGLLVTGAVALVKWFKRTSKEAERLNEETEELGDATEALSESVNDSAESYKDQRKESQENAQSNVRLGKTIEDLANKENKSAAEKQMLASYIEELNGSVDGLNLAYDEEADALSMSSEQLQARLDLTKEQVSYNDALERQVEIEKEQQQVVSQLHETNALREEWNQKLDEGSVKAGEHKTAIAELDEQEELLKQTNVELSEQWAVSNEEMTASMEAITEAVESGVVNQIIAFEDLSESQQAVVESMKSTWEDYYDAATDMFDKLSDEATMTVDEMQSNLEENQRIIGEWAEGIATLAERGVDEGLLNTLKEAGPESAGHVNALVNASDGELEKLSNVFSNGGDVATDALSKSLGIEESGVMDAVGHLVSDTEQSLSAQIQSADFKGLGVDIAKGQAEGIKSGTPQSEDAAREMAQATENAAREASETRSPSRVFERIGGDLTAGMTLGINNGTAKVVSTAKKLSVSIIRQYNGMRGQFQGIGSNAMAGLNAGLNAGSGRVMATARRIANNAAATMKRALRIHSPSRVFRDDIGKMLPEGISEGIEDGEKSLLDRLKIMSGRVVDIATPEMALGNPALAGAGNISNNNVYQNEANVTNHIDVHYTSTGDTQKDAKNLIDEIDKGLAKKKGFNNFFKGGKQ